MDNDDNNNDDDNDDDDDTLEIFPEYRYAKISEPFLMGASYYPEEVPLNLGSLISAYWPN